MIVTFDHGCQSEMGKFHWLLCPRGMKSDLVLSCRKINHRLLNNGDWDLETNWRRVIGVLHTALRFHWIQKVKSSTNRQATADLRSQNFEKLEVTSKTFLQYFGHEKSSSILKNGKQQTCTVTERKQENQWWKALIEKVSQVPRKRARPETKILDPLP